jgi:cell division transport system permease protein
MLNLKRILGNSWKNFSRNIWLSVATLFVMLIALSVIGSLVLFNASLDVFVAGLKDKVDVSVYFAEEAQEGDILEVKSTLEQTDEVRFVRYISKNEALDIFSDRHADNEIILASLEELGENPLQASLNIKVHEPEQFESVVNFLENSVSAGLIDSIDFRENQRVIDSISSISADVTRAGIVLTIILAALVLFVTFNTIRLAIYTARDEVYIMKLVGASNWFVRGPFVLTGALFSVLAGLIVIGAFFGGTWLLSSQVSLIFADIDLYRYLIEHWLSFTTIVLGSGLVLGSVSSWLAVKRYLKT